MIGTSAERLEAVSVRWLEARKANPARGVMALVDLAIMGVGAGAVVAIIVLVAS